MLTYWTASYFSDLWSSRSALGAPRLPHLGGVETSERPRSVENVRWQDLLKIGARQFGDPNFPNGNAHAWFLVYACVRLQRVDLLQEADSGVRDLFGGEAQHFEVGQIINIFFLRPTSMKFKERVSFYL